MTRTIEDLQRELWNSPEWIALAGYRQLGLSLRLFFNADERLNEVLDVATGEWLDFDWWEPGNEPLRAQILEEIVRRLHQYGASAITLLDHVQNFAVTLGRAHEEIVRVEVRRRFLDDPLSSFMRDLRNYSVHEQLPVVAHMLGDKELTGRKHIHLRKADLNLESPYWRGAARAFIAAAPESLDLSDLLEQYRKSTYEFSVWFGDRNPPWIHQALVRVRELETGLRDVMAVRFTDLWSRGLAMYEQGIGTIEDVGRHWLSPAEVARAVERLADFPEGEGALAYIEALEQKYGPMSGTLRDRTMTALRADRLHVLAGGLG